MAWQWERLGRLIGPNPGIPWLATGTSASFVRPLDDDRAELWLTGRSVGNISSVGVVHLKLGQSPEVLAIEPSPRFTYGEVCTFDETGVAYPWLVEDGDRMFMYYVGWVRGTPETPFRNNTGLAVSANGGRSWQRVSRAPILPATDLEPCGTGSCCVLREGDRWRMWYTSFVRWERKESGLKHYYVIRHAESDDGIHWQRKSHRCIDFADDGEYAISRPSVIKLDGRYHMWFVFRGEAYRIGYAVSDDGVNWKRLDDDALPVSPQKTWDSEAVCYPHVFEAEGEFYMLYCGNEYGRGGVGLAHLLRNSQSDEPDL